MSTEHERFNEEVRAWSKASVTELRSALAGANAKHTGRLIREMRARVGMQFGVANRVSFGFLRYLVYLEKGASRGYGGKKGSTWYTAGTKRKTNPRSLGRMGTGPRAARPTYNPTMDKRVPVLAGIVAKFYGDLAVKSINIR